MASSLNLQLRHISCSNKLISLCFSKYYFSILSDSPCLRSNDENYWLERLNHRDWLSPNEILKIFSHIKNPESLIPAFQKAKNRIDYKPNEPLYALLIEKLVFAGKFSEVGTLLGTVKLERIKLSEVLFHRLVKMYGNIANDTEGAIETLRRMPEFCSSPSVKTFNYVLNLLVNNRQFQVIHELYLYAPRLGITIDTCSFNILIKGLCKIGQFEASIKLFDEMPKQGCPPNTTTYSTLIHYLSRNNRVQEAFEMYERMCNDGSAPPDTVLFNILISGLCINKRVDEALGLLKQMPLNNCSPNSGTYQALLDGLINSKRYLEAKDFIQLMVSNGVRPSFLSYKVAIHGLCNKKCLDSAHFVLKCMVQQGFTPRIGIWRKLLKSVILG
jgi:pentatricopeptide repeat protein